MRHASVSLLLPVLLALCGCGQPAADTVFQHGRIYTVDAQRSWAEAVAIRDGRFVFVGSNAGASAYIGAQTEVVDLRGRMVLPGMQDAHVHPIETGLEAAILNLGELVSIDAYKEAIADYAGAHPELPWIVGTGWTYSVFGAGVTPNREILDALVPDRPVYIASYDDHAGWVNSAALQLAGITKDTPDPPGGQIVRDATSGEPNGTLQEEARALVKKLLPVITFEEKIEALRYAQRQLNAWGITAIQDAGVDGEEELRVYKTLEDAGELKLRVVAAMRWYPERGLEQIDELVSLRDQYRSALLDAGTAKIWQDGILDNFTGVMLEPYLSPGYGTGTPLIDPEFLKTVVTRLDAAGFQAHIHAIGDAAVRQSLDAVAASIEENGRLGHRHHIAHLQLIDPADIPRFAELDVIANFQPLWARADEYVLGINLPTLGPERMRWMYPIKSVLDAGGMIVFGSDWSVTTANPFPQIETAITRREAEAEPTPEFTPEQRIDLPSAIAAFTINAAFVNRHEFDTGSIEIGKLADLIVIDQNLFEISPEDMSETRVLLTLLAGKPVFGELRSLAAPEPADSVK